MKFLQREKEKLVVCTCLFVVLVAMTDLSFLGQVCSTDKENSRTLSETDSESGNESSDLSVFN